MMTMTIKKRKAILTEPRESFRRARLFIVSREAMFNDNFAVRLTAFHIRDGIRNLFKGEFARVQSDS